MISFRFSCLPFIALLPLVLNIADAGEEKADPKWNEIVEACHDGATCRKKPDGDIELRLGKSDHEEIIRYHSEGGELKSAIILLRYYPLKDQGLDPTSTANFEIFRIAFSGKEQTVFHLEADGPWKELPKPELSKAAADLFPIALNHLDDEASK